MGDYIKREDALKAVDDIVCDADDAERTCDRIIDIPSADVAPVRHGRWIETSYDEYTCSVCGKNVSDEIFYAIGPEDRESASMCVANYCPNCGAKMDEEE